jgi:hypothetical protein
MIENRTNGFITLTYISEVGNKTTPVPGQRVQIRHIVGYRPEGTGAFVQTSGGASYKVAETPDQIDRKIKDNPNK